jgi:hypothetical protein
MKTLAELKREANTGKLSMEMIEWYGKFGDDIPERLRGIRKVKRSNSVAVILLNADGKESELRIDSAKLIDYDGDSLIIYNAGEREPNEEERAVLNEIKKIYEKYADTYNGGYWQVKDYCKNCPCPWMYGMSETIKGKRYQTYNGKVRDNSIKGDVLIRYRVYAD